MRFHIKSSSYHHYACRPTMPICNYRLTPPADTEKTCVSKNFDEAICFQLYRRGEWKPHAREEKDV